MNLLVITGIFPPDIGGPATYVPTLSSELVGRGHNVRVVTLSDTLAHDDRSYSFPVRRIRRSIFKPLRFLLSVMSILQEGRHAHVLYVNGLYLEAVIANFFMRKRLVQKVVGDWAWEWSSDKGWVKDSFEEFQKRRYGLRVELLKSLRSFCVRRADAVIVPSRYLGRTVATWAKPEKKIVVIYNAVESISPSRSNIPLRTRIKLVTVGRLIALKQIDHLIRAVAECDETGLVIVGDGPERQRLESIVCDHGLTERVYFAGRRGKEETLALMAACDLFVLNSTHEGFPHVLLEAMSMDLPVVATAVGGTTELVRDGKNGLLISPRTNGVLSSILRKLLSCSEERQRLAAGGRETIQRFRQSAMIEQTEAILESSLSRSATNREARRPA